MPAGYMPASLADGGPYVLCPGGFQGELLRYLGASHGHHAGHAGVSHGSSGDTPAEQNGHHHWTNCSIGAALCVIAPVSASAALPAADPSHALPGTVHTVPPARVGVRRQPIRAPPSVLLS